MREKVQRDSINYFRERVQGVLGPVLHRRDSRAMAWTRSSSATSARASAGSTSRCRARSLRPALAEREVRKSTIRVPFRILTKEEDKFLEKNYKDIEKQVKEASRRRAEEGSWAAPVGAGLGVHSSRPAAGVKVRGRRSEHGSGRARVQDRLRQARDGERVVSGSRGVGPGPAHGLAVRQDGHREAQGLQAGDPVVVIYASAEGARRHRHRFPARPRRRST